LKTNYGNFHGETFDAKWRKYYLVNKFNKSSKNYVSQGVKILTQYSCAKLKGVSRQYIFKLVKDGRTIPVDGKGDPQQADEVPDETRFPRRNDHAMQKLLETALHNFVWHAGESGFDVNELEKVAKNYLKHDELINILKSLGTLAWWTHTKSS